MEKQNLFRFLRAKIRRVRIFWRLNEAMRGLFLASCFFSVVILVGIAVGRIWWLRGALLTIAAGGAVISIILLVLFPLIRRITDEDVAIFLEGKYPWLKNRLISSIQLWEPYRKGETIFSPDMYEAILSETIDEANKFSLLKVLKWRRTARVFSVFAGVCVLYLVLALRAPGFNERALDYISPPYLPLKEVFHLRSITGDVVVARGGTVRIEAVFSGNLSGIPVIELQREALEPIVVQMNKAAFKWIGGVRRPRPTGRDEGRRFFRASVSPITDDMEYSVRYRSFRSRSYRIHAVDAPAIRSIRVRLEYPAYTGILPETLHEGGDIRAPYGTGVKLEIISTSALKRAWIELNGVEKGCTLTSKNQADVNFEVLSTGSYRVHLVDEYGFKNLAPPSFSITSVPDEPPSIQLINPKSDLRQSKTEPVVIQALARDDYSVDKVSLHYRVVGTNKSGEEKISVNKGQSVDFEYRWNILRIKAYENDTVEFYLKVTDNDVLTGPKSAVSETRRILIISESEDYRQIEKSQNEILTDLESALREGNSISNQFQDLRREISSGKVGAKQQADLQRALQRQEDLEKELVNLSKSLEDINEKMQQNRLIGPETIEKMRQINQLLDQILSDEMKKALENIREAAKRTDISGLDKLLMDSILDQEKITRSLDLTLTRLKRIQAEQKMEALSLKMQKLVEDQKNITEAADKLRRKQEAGGLSPAEKAESERLSQEEQSVRSEMQDVMKGMEDLRKTFEGFDRELARKTEEIEKNAQKDATDSDLRKAAEKLSALNPTDAEPPAEAALQNMESLSKALASLQENYFARANAAIVALILAALQKTINISTRQEDLLPSFEEIRDEPPHNLTVERTGKLAQDEKFLHGTATKLYRDLINLSGMTMAIPLSALEEAHGAAEGLQDAVESIRSTNALKAYTDAHNAYMDLNNLGIDLIEAAKTAKKFSARMEMEEYLRRLEELARSQQDINQGTKKLGESGMPIPSMASALQQLALQQAMVGEGMGKLLKEMGNLGGIGDRLGQIQEDMEEVSKTLKEGSADREVQKRQSNILRRLQDATLSLKKESLEEKRVAEVGKEYEPAKPSPLFLPGKRNLPDEIRIEMKNYSRKKYPKGFERPVEKYYEELNK